MNFKKTITVRYLTGSDKYIGIQLKGKYLEKLGLKNGDKINLIATDENDLILTKNEKFSKNIKVKNCLSEDEIGILLDIIPESKLSDLRLKVIVLLLMETGLSIDNIVEIKKRQFSEDFDLLYIEDGSTNLYKAVELSNNLGRTIRNFKMLKFANSCTTDYLMFNTSRNTKMNQANVARQIAKLNKKLDFNISIDILRNSRLI